MIALLGFAVTLLIAVLLSGFARRSVISTAALFLIAGFVVGTDIFGAPGIQTDAPSLRFFIEIAVFAVLFTDGMHVGIRDLLDAWRLPGRALLVGMPLTFVGIALSVYLLTDFSWTEALLIGAVLSPTDPVFAAAIIGREAIPNRLRHLLNVESGLNDGLVLPVVLVILAALGGTEWHIPTWLGELLLGIALGVAVPWLVIRLQRSRYLSAAEVYEPLLAFSVGVLVFALGSMFHANLFLAAFSAGVTVATMNEAIRQAFAEFGETVTELLKLAALFVFGLLITPEILANTTFNDIVILLLVLLVIRPVAIYLALLGSNVSGQEKVAAAWFGPKGFASVVYGLLILSSGITNADSIFQLIAFVIIGSMIAHSSTDVVVARWFGKSESQPKEAERDEAKV